MFVRMAHWVGRRSRTYASVFVLFGILASLVTPTATFAAGGTTGSLRGQVVEPTTNVPVPGAAITASSPSGSYKEVSDGNGRFNFLSIPSDTYTLSIEKSGFQSQSITGVTVLGDSTVDLGKLSALKSIKTIGRITARSASSAFQPSQTQDTYTVSGQRISQALGNQSSVDEKTLLQSVPGVIPTFDSTNGVGLSVRGSLNVELGYQYDGVPFSAPFFNENGSGGFLNNLSGGTGGSVQVVSGAGDATQGDNGGGTINTIVPRGAYPGEGTLDLEIAGPYYNHTLNFNDSFATPNGRISNYFAYSGSRYVPKYAPYGASSLDQTDPLSSTYLNGQYFNVGYAAHDDITDNFVYRFGKNNNQSLQILERNANQREYSGYGGLQGLQYFSSSPAFLGTFSSAFPGFTPAAQNAYLAALIPPLPYQPQNGQQVIQPDNVVENPLQFLKFEYTNNLNATTYFNGTYYNWGLTNGGTNYSNFPQNGAFGTQYSPVGGTRTGFIASITKTIGDKQTVTLEGKYENAKPYWNLQAPADGLFLLEGAFGFSPGANQPQVSDWFLPQNPGQPVSAGNPCLGPGSDLASAVSSGSGGCYLYSQLLAQGKYNGSLPQIPTFGINYHGTDQQQWGIGLRDQYSPTDRLHLDLGVRIDGEQNRFGPDQLGAATPSDVAPSKVGNAFSRPREIEPRAAVSYQIGSNDSIRASYGRSTSFFFGQTLGTPFNLTGLDPRLASVAAKDTASAPACGSGTHGPGPGYTSVPTNYQSGANLGAPAYFFKCPSYAVGISSLYDQLLDAPDLGGFGPPTYNNYDFAYSHQFARGILHGWGTHATAYARTGFNVEQNVLLLNGPPNPISGQSSASVFTTLANGSERTFGIEAQLTTPEIPTGRAGASGYATFDYINEYTNTPPVAGGSTLPILAGQLLQSGQFFRAGFVPPVTLSTGLTYQFKNGLRVTPSLVANNGYAFGVGRSAFGFVNGVLYTLPETNYGVNVPYAGPAGPGHSFNASYFVDPQVPGSSFNPNIVASRGYNEPAIAGNGKSPAQAYLNVDLEYPISKTTTLGFQAFNVTNNVYTVPQVNTLYQPVANGVAGPQSGKISASLPYGTNYQIGAGDESFKNGSTLPFLNGYGPGVNFNFYARLKI